MMMLRAKSDFTFPAKYYIVQTDVGNTFAVPSIGYAMVDEGKFSLEVKSVYRNKVLLADVSKQEIVDYLKNVVKPYDIVVDDRGDEITGKNFLEWA